MTASAFEPIALHPVVADPHPPVLALHASASSGAQWKGLADYLRGRYRVIAPDLPGYGMACLHGSRNLADIADRVVGAMLGTSVSMHVVGHGLGAAVALEIAAVRPGLVRSLTLIEPMAFHLLRDGDGSDLELFSELSDLAGRMAALTAAGCPEAGMQAYVDFWYGDGAWSRTGAGLRKVLARQAEHVARDLLGSLALNRSAAHWSDIRCPTLVVMGLESPVASLRVTEMVAETINGARLMMISEAGHMAPLTDPHIIDPMIGVHLGMADGLGWPVRDRAA
ncbi:3-oxoadipate enol-lactonase [Mesorhizobium sp. L-8-10]|uniref:alpha/beta fold hydrolase n=1 Tax=unclassified Mesorhizobium TaxID=325217 RepID=UPI001926E33C|nr:MULTISPECIES: alpha/beta fold hydrolase [unclassified Mesorhizobium]BCH27947.1 3-oxoadipate enol-lactonase [Mesorhizobium sp. L-8-3]BCH35829.1 3-oxoadipate enol-lactonase [Mesorhizobium sp. L-8-10]